MALEVEDGTGKSNAESYISVADADAYFALRSGNEWAVTWAAIASDDLKESALRDATEFMASRYGLRWKGDRVSADQALDWPRECVEAYGFSLASDAVPLTVQRVCAEYAARASTGSLQADVGAQVKQETVGPISVTYADGARQTTAYKLLDAKLSPYLQGVGIQVVRA